MAVIQISRIQHRRGKEQDFPQLASAELGWSLDTRRLFIGNGSLLEGAPTEGATEILTEYSNVLDLSKSYTFQGNDIAGFVIDTGVDKNNPVVRTLQSKLDDFVSVRDFGAKGDGLTDDTAAIQRALDRPLGAAEAVVVGAANFRHRSVYFPAGNYLVSSTILIPAYTKIYGEGKSVSRIIGNIDGPVARLCDTYGQVGEDFGASNGAGVDPYISEYHITDLTFWQTETTYTQPCFQIDGGLGIFITHCQFRGGLIDTPEYDGTTNDSYFFDRGAGVAAMYIPALSYYNSVEQIYLTGCDMYNHNYGIQIDNDIRNAVIRDCYFDRTYQAVVVGRDLLDPAYFPKNVVVESCHFRHSSREAIWCGTSAKAVISAHNYFGSAANGAVDEYGTTGAGPYNYSQISPTITFNSDFCYSIGDYFDRTWVASYSQEGTTVSIDPDKRPWIPNNSLINIRYTTGSAVSGAFVLNTESRHNHTYQADVAQTTSGRCYLEYSNMYPEVETNGYQCVVVGQDFGLEQGLMIKRAGRKITLPDIDPGAMEASGLMLGYSNDPNTNVEIKYTIEHNSARRMGTLSIVNYNNDITWDDEYRESDDVKFEWQVVPVGSVTGADASFSLPSSSRGTGYSADIDVPTTALTGSGRGLTLKIMSYVGGDALESYAEGELVLVYVMNPGSGYAVGDTVSVDTGNSDAVVTITHVKSMEIQYQSTAVGDPAVLTYNLNYFNA